MFEPIINEIKKDPEIVPYLYKVSPKMFAIDKFIEELQCIPATGFCIDINTVEEAKQFLNIILPFIDKVSEIPNLISKSLIKAWQVISNSGNIPLIQHYHHKFGKVIMAIVQYARKNNISEELYRAK